jgi:hypothetical protein
VRLAELVAMYLSRIDGPKPSAPESDRPAQRQGPPTASTPDRFRQGPHLDLPPFISNWPPEWLEFFEERAAIMEFDANLPRAGAEVRAVEDTRRVYRGQRENGDAAPPGGNGHHEGG